MLQWCIECRISSAFLAVLTTRQVNLTFLKTLISNLYRIKCMSNLKLSLQYHYLIFLISLRILYSFKIRAFGRTMILNSSGICYYMAGYFLSFLKQNLKKCRHAFLSSGFSHIIIRPNSLPGAKRQTYTRRY